MTRLIRRFRKKRSRRLSPRTKKILLMTLRTLLVAALPFYLLVSGAVLSHRFMHMPGWSSLGIGCALATLCVGYTTARLWRRMTGKHRLREISRNIALPIVLGFAVYSLGWFSHFNAKSARIRDLYTELHPALRLAIGTATLADPSVVITEISRERSDYAEMGLTPVSNSLHFEQEDGWIHAVDIRTRDRSAIRNALSQLYFRAMGFRALRHGGTGDHLHVALPRPPK